MIRVRDRAGVHRRVGGRPVAGLVGPQLLALALLIGPLFAVLRRLLATAIVADGPIGVRTLISRITIAISGGTR